MLSTPSRYLLLAASLWLAACGNSSSPSSVPSSVGDALPAVTPADPATLILKAETVLPPGQSGFVSSAGQAQGQASGAPGDYGAHLDDQRDLYWQFKAKPATLGTKPGTPGTLGTWSRREE